MIARPTNENTGQYPSEGGAGSGAFPHTKYVPILWTEQANRNRTDAQPAGTTRTDGPTHQRRNGEITTDGRKD